MIINGCLPNNATYTRSVSRVDLLKLFVAIICELDIVIYISLIDGLCKMGELDFSIEMQNLMVEKGWPQMFLPTSV